MNVPLIFKSIPKESYFQIHAENIKGNLFTSLRKFSTRNRDWQMTLANLDALETFSTKNHYEFNEAIMATINKRQSQISNSKSLLSSTFINFEIAEKNKAVVGTLKATYTSTDKPLIQ